jgi:putative hemolysin
MIYLEISLVLVLISLNGLLAMSELAIVSARTARLKAMARKEVKGAAAALALMETPGRFLSTVQIGITLVGVLSGAYSGATLGDRFSEWLIAKGVAQDWAYIIGVGLIVTVITYLSLIIGELVPKQIALRNPEAIAVRVAAPMKFLARIAAPLVWVLDVSGALVLRMLGKHQQSGQSITEEEIKLLVMEAEQAGVLETAERSMITGVLRLADRPVSVVMTPRGEVDTINLQDPPDKIISELVKSPHSRLPVYDGNPDEILGILWSKDFIGNSMDDPRKLVRQAPIIPATADVLDAVEILRRSDIHMGLVHDEYGSFEGVLTSADILESIVGAFRTEEGAPEPGIVTRGDGSLLISGWLPFDEFAERLSLQTTTSHSAQTAAGFVIHLLGRLPKTGDSVATEDYSFEVVDMDGRRIDKILATRLRKTDEN